jgi:filamentous hemagglutinin family protein
MDESTARSRNPDSIEQTFLWALLPILVLFLAAPSLGDAQVTTSITSTTGTGDLGTSVTQAGNLYNITGGTRPGSGPNLFHSFGDFSVGAGDIGNFLNTPVNGSLPVTSNILSRVTGGNISNIYGTLQTTDFGNANLFLVNPSGIVFGPNGSVNVGGSVSFTTAQYLRLFDGVNSANFYANPARDGLANSVLAVAPVVDFGFLSPAAYGFLTPPGPNATITVQGSALSVPSGQSISLVGGKVIIEGATLPDQTVQRTQLSAPNGSIKLASAASPGEFDVATLASLPNVDSASFTSFGTINMAPGSSIDVSGASTVFVKGGQLVLSVNDATLSTSESTAPQDTISLSSGSSIVTSTSGADPGADVQLTAGTLQMDGTLVQTLNSGDRAGGNISINATTVGLTNGTIILDFTGLDFNTGTVVGSGNGGNVTVQGLGGAGSHADSFALSNSVILTQTVGPGKGGEVQLNAGTLTMDNFSSISTGTSVGDGGQGGGGVGGDVVLNVRTANLLGGASILSQTKNFTPEGGQGGKVIIQGLQGVGSTAESMTLSGGSSLLTQNDGGSDGGRVAITSKSLTMDGPGTTMNSSVFNVGRGGDVVVSVQQASLSGGATIKTQTNSSQVGPTLTVQGLQGAGSMADSVVLAGSGTGIISDSVGSTGSTGKVAVQAKTVSLTDGAVIQAGTTVTTAAGGNVTIEADSVDLSSGSRISSQAGDSDAGQITITTNTFTLDNSSIATNTQGQGRGGEVVLKVGSVSFANGATINSSSTGPGNAGNITITSASNVIMQNSSITTASDLSSGGQIEINAPEMVRLANSLVSTSVKGAAGDSDGGNITIDPQFVILQNNSQIIARAFAGSGGEINVTAGVFLADPSSVVDASSQRGPQGTVNIQSPVQNLGEQLTPLAQQFSSAAALLAQRCAARVADGKFSTFVVAGREGLPVEPGGFLASPSWTAEQFGSNLSAQYPNRLIAAVTGSFPEYDAKPIQLAKYGDACRQ